jgi:hypothetical protein
VVIQLQTTEEEKEEVMALIVILKYKVLTFFETLYYLASE